VYVFEIEALSFTRSAGLIIVLEDSANAMNASAVCVCVCVC